MTEPLAERQFLDGAGWPAAQVLPLVADASGRRYSRVLRVDGTSAILMSAPMMTEADRSSLSSFRIVAAHLLDLGLSAPRELAADPAAGLLLLEDFGNRRLSDMVDQRDANAQRAYTCATDVTMHLSRSPSPEWAASPRPEEQAEMVRLTLELCDAADALRDDLIGNLAEALRVRADGPPVLSLRDFHGDNLMWLPRRAGLARIGLLDFQDAVALPLGYDLASLVDDPRREVPAGWRESLIVRFARAVGLPDEAALARIDTLSLLRNLRILGIFHRRETRLGRAGYRAFLPRTGLLIDRAVANPALSHLRHVVASLRQATADWMPSSAS